MANDAGDLPNPSEQTGASESARNLSEGIGQAMELGIRKNPASTTVEYRRGESVMHERGYVLRTDLLTNEQRKAQEVASATSMHELANESGSTVPPIKDSDVRYYIAVHATAQMGASMELGDEVSALLVSSDGKHALRVRALKTAVGTFGIPSIQGDVDYLQARTSDQPLTARERINDQDMEFTYPNGAVSPEQQAERLKLLDVMRFAMEHGQLDPKVTVEQANLSAAEHGGRVIDDTTVEARETNQGAIEQSARHIVSAVKTMIPVVKSAVQKVVTTGKFTHQTGEFVSVPYNPSI